MVFFSKAGAITSNLACFVGIVVVVGICVHVASGETCENDPVSVNPADIKAGKLIPSKPFLTVPVTTVVDCASFCHRYSRCETFNLNVEEKKCDLNEKMVGGESDNSPDWQHANKNAWQLPMNLKGCAEFSCPDDSGCYDVHTLGPTCVRFPQ